MDPWEEYKARHYVHRRDLKFWFAIGMIAGALAYHYSPIGIG